MVAAERYVAGGRLLAVTGPDEPGAAESGAARVDLHAHTVASDGTATPMQLVAAAGAARLAAVAVTDHDSVASVAEVTRHAATTGLRVIAGVELSVHDNTGKELHVLGLHLSELDRIERALSSVREARVDRAMEMVAKLNALGIALDPQAVMDEAAGGALGRPHVARALVRAGHATELQQAFDRWLGAGKPAYVEKAHLSVADGIAMVHDAGGIAVYAHPGPAGTHERIAPLVAVGLDGVEVRHPSHGASDIKRLRAVVAALDLVPSGGSDWHGATEGPRTLGCMNVSAEWLDRQLQRVAARGAATA